MARPPVSEQIDSSELHLVTGLLDEGFTVEDVADKMDTDACVVYRFLKIMGVNVKDHYLRDGMTISEFKRTKKLQITEPTILTFQRKPKYIVVPYEEYKERLL
jgi:hypothetical protein